MAIKIVGKADRSWSVDQLINERARYGADYLDLKTGNLVNIASDTESAPPGDEPTLEGKYTREELEKMGMKELRKIGARIGAEDTKKSELINEILEKQ
jgi:hypothetical protein